MTRGGSVSQATGNSTIADVARRAGVSLKSVSRVINKEPHVSPKLLAKVSAAISELNYVPDPAARSLAGQRSFTIGLLFDNPSPHYTMKAIIGAYRACVAQGYHMRFDTLNSRSGSALLSSQLDAVVRNGRTDGFVLTPPLTDNREVLDYLERHNIQYVRIAPAIDPGRSAAVSIDDVAAAAQAAQYLCDLGHRIIGLVNGPPDHGAAITRRQGFIERLKSISPDIVLHEAKGDFLFESGISAGEALLSEDPRPTAIFATNDDMAAGLLVACGRCRLVVPDDVSLVGFDDSWIATSVWPYLTTVHQPIEDMAAEAVQLLLAQTKHGQPYEDHMLDYHLVVRESSSPPAEVTSDERTAHR
ncbi:LacI family DNA-binding transcriptional regulator [Sphingobium sp. DEHP117]|uniref:LacI family DNA-binding transcriptional regulator n=1 Tax=Sphingobium sp. DEHP117 TaxID=2993436 RepID=UPI0027D533B0|nr:substrate-binding domain-containing protein [Sphingobium sp. DEHP117]MDQ4421539.1 LacI family DNA-binding transcriptional regulator [Sphingobium sp. DEHP117]